MQAEPPPKSPIDEATTYDFIPACASGLPSPPHRANRSAASGSARKYGLPPSGGGCRRAAVSAYGNVGTTWHIRLRSPSESRKPTYRLRTIKVPAGISGQCPATERRPPRSAKAAGTSPAFSTARVPEPKSSRDARQRATSGQSDRTRQPTGPGPKGRSRKVPQKLLSVKLPQKVPPENPAKAPIFIPARARKPSPIPTRPQGPAHYRPQYKRGCALSGTHPHPFSGSGDHLIITARLAS